MCGRDRPAFSKLTELAGDFLYAWEGTGEAPDKAAARLLDLLLRAEFVNEAMAEVHRDGI
jgi:hypothetical protein